MKLTFFLIAICLVSVRAYLSWSGHLGGHGDNEGSITISNGDYRERIKWSGKIKLSDDEKTIASISPGGYLKFRQNEKKLLAESNLKAEISYQLYDGRSQLHLNDSGKNFISAVLKEMIEWGFNAQGRAERIYRQGGIKAVLNEIANIKMDAVKFPYFDLLYKNDSIGSEDMLQSLNLLALTGEDADREKLLKLIAPRQIKDSIIAVAWLEAAGHLDADIQKVNLLNYFIENDSVSDESFKVIMNITDHLNSDMDKKNMLTKILKKKPLRADRWNAILEITTHLNADMDKQFLFHLLIESKDITEQQWLELIQFASQQNADMDKSNLLVLVAQKMPKTDNTIAAYRQAARTINNDTEYGRTIKMIE